MKIAKSLKQDIRIPLGEKGSLCDLYKKEFTLFGVTLRRSLKKRYTRNTSFEYLSFFTKSLLGISLKSFKNEGKLYGESRLKIGRCTLFKRVLGEKSLSLFVLGVRVFKSSRSTRFEEHFPEVKDHDLIWLANSNSGEFFMALRYTLPRVKHNKLLIITNRKYHLAIASLLAPNATLKYDEDLMDYVYAKDFVTSTGGKACLLYESGFYVKTTADTIKKTPDFFYLDNILEYLRVKEAAVKAPDLGLSHQVEDYIFIAPRAASVKDCDEFFIGVIHLACEKGLKVFINLALKDQPLNLPKNLAKSCEIISLDFKESLKIAAKARAIVGLRSGFLEFLSLAKRPLFVLYTEVKNRDDLSPQMLKDGYSLGKFPGLEEAVFESVNPRELMKEFKSYLKVDDEKKLKKTNFK